VTPADHRDSSSGGRKGDDWLGDVEGLDWDDGARQPFSWPEQRETGTRSSEGVTLEAQGVADEHPDDAIFRRRRAIGLVVALAIVGGLIWLAVATFGSDSGSETTPATTSAVTTEQPVTTTPATTTPATTTPTTSTPTTTTPSSTTPSTTEPALTLAEGEKLQLESTGSQVQQLQTALAELGYDPGPIDGDYGPLTQAAVVQFQTAQGLEPDGVVGPQTTAALNAAIAGQASG
jgi:putative peptidoglycan binding protein